MASAHTNGPNPLHPNFILTPQQQNLLFRALTSNQQANQANDASPGNNGVSLSPSSLNASPAQFASNGVQESPYLDYDYDFNNNADNSFDFDFTDTDGKMIGDLPGDSPEDEDNSKSSSPDNDADGPDKRSLEEDDDDKDEEGGGKRRESEGKVAKKPGRKPLTNEPSSKRKAQNRAAQRAFRERKEQHLKDLETKVQELEKTSENVNTENSQLRSKLDKMTVELNEYKKRVALLNNSSRSLSGSARPAPPFGPAMMNNINDVNFQFEFPKFGVLPGPNQAKPTYPSPPASNKTSGQSPSVEKARDQASPSSFKSRENSDSQASKDALAAFSGLFNSASPYDNTTGNVSRSSLDSSHFSISGTTTGSPCSTTNSNMGPSSSCGTSPEPFTQSPMGSKPLDTLTTIGEEQTNLSGTNVSAFGDLAGNSIDFSNFDWLAQQNGGQFDPQLFTEYREPQENILANTTFDDNFFNDAFDVDFTTPYNVAPSPNAPKKNLIAEIDARKDTEDTIVPAANGNLLTCNNIWEKLQTCPKVQNGDLDLDGLCSDLQKKAKCGGSGAVVDEQDFKAVMTKYLGSEAGLCPNSSA